MASARRNGFVTKACSCCGGCLAPSASELASHRAGMDIVVDATAEPVLLPANIPLRREVACRGMLDDTFQPNRPEEFLRAKAICDTCLSTQSCLRQGLEIDGYGVWGGVMLRAGKEVDWANMGAKKGRKAGRKPGATNKRKKRVDAAA